VLKVTVITGEKRNRKLIKILDTDVVQGKPSAKATHQKKTLEAAGEAERGGTDWERGRRRFHLGQTAVRGGNVSVYDPTQGGITVEARQEVLGS